jgi:hypothetical protein
MNPTDYYIAIIAVPRGDRTMVIVVCVCAILVGVAGLCSTKLEAEKGCNKNKVRVHHDNVLEFELKGKCNIQDQR